MPPIRLATALLVLLFAAPDAAAQSFRGATGLPPEPAQHVDPSALVIRAPDRSAPAYRAIQQTFTVTTNADSGPGSLREAIEAANASPGLDSVAFAIDGGGAFAQIDLLSLLPAITDPIVIDGDSQGCDLDEGLCIRLDGAALEDTDARDIGLKLYGGGSTIHGLNMTRFFREDGWEAIFIRSGGNVISGCYLGTDRTGTVTDPDGVPGSGDELGNGGGIMIGSRFDSNGSAAVDNLIGGPTDADRNVIAGSTRFYGIAIFEDGSDRNQVINNYIGTDVTGTVALRNASIGIVAGGDSTLIQGNVVSGNDVGGIAPADLASGGSNFSRIVGNFVGTDATGTRALPNGTLEGLAAFEGIGITVALGEGHVVEDNVVSGNLLAGIALGASFDPLLVSGTVVRRNLVGTDASGTAPLPNGVPNVPDVGFGIVLFSGGAATVTGNVIGGDAFADANVIGFNTTAGVGAQGPNISGNVIDHNYIGVTAEGVPIPNGLVGVLMRQFPSSNRIGSATMDGGGNVIGFQPIGVGFGADVAGADVAYNTFVGEPGAYLPVDLGLDGPTANDAFDSDLGPNRLQNAPVIEAADVVGDQLTVRFSVDTAPSNAVYPLTVRFYEQVLNGNVLTYRPVGEATYAEADAQQEVSAAITLAAPLQGGPPALIATATDAEGNTGEASLQATPVPAEEGATAHAAAVSPAFPNPFRGEARFHVTVPQAERVTAELYDVLGRRVAVLHDGVLAAGEPQPVRISGGGLAAGAYLVRVTSPSLNASFRVTLLR